MTAQPELAVRSFREEDQAEVSLLINQNLSQRFGVVDPQMNPDLIDISLSYPEGAFLVACARGKIVGTGALITETRSVGRIVRMHTSSQVRRQGIGRRLLDELEARATAAGFKELVLETTDDWFDAISFYLACGFKETGRQDGEIHFMKPLASIG